MRTKAVIPALAIIFWTVCGYGLPTYSQDQTPSQTSKPSAAPLRVKLGGEVAVSRLVTQVQVSYPEIAKAAGVSGTVVLHVIIAKDGAVESAEYVSGPNLLLHAAMDAVRQWRYKPFVLDGQPVEVDTMVSVVFTLDAPANSTEPPVDPQFKQDAMMLLDAMDYRTTAAKAVEASFEANRSAVETQFPDTPNKEKIIDEYRDKLVGLVQSQEFVDKVVAVYAKYLSDDDVKNLMQFYQSPSGKHFSDAQTGLMNDLGQAGVQLGREKILGILTDICNEYPELQGKARACAVVGKGPEPASPQSAPDSQPK